MTRDDCLLLGTIAKTHGVKGDLIIRTSDPSYDLQKDRESIFLQIDGILVPFFISGLRLFKEGEWIISLDWYEDRTRAESLVGYQVWVPKELMDEPGDEFYMEQLAGYRFLDIPSGKTGLINEFMDIPDNPVLEVDIEGEKVLVPAREEFILDFDPGEKLIRFELPRGLL